MQLAKIKLLGKKKILFLKKNKEERISECRPDRVRATLGSTVELTGKLFPNPIGRVRPVLLSSVILGPSVACVKPDRKSVV